MTDIKAGWEVEGFIERLTQRNDDNSGPDLHDTEPNTNSDGRLDTRTLNKSPAVRRG